MTVATTHAENKFTGDGVQTVFTFTFQVVKTAPNLVVLKSNVVQVGTYTTAINADQEASPGGTVTFSVAPANGAEVIVRRVNPQTQSTDFPLEAKLSTASVEAALDKAYMCVQEVSREISQKTFRWMGTWSSTVAYLVGDAVAYNGTSYICTTANTNSAPPSANWSTLASKGDTGADGTDGIDGLPGLNWRGAWNSGTAYAVNDGVSYSGSSYICTTAHTNSAPPSANWNTLASKGTDGSGTGDVVGPASVTDGRVAVFDGTTGKLLKQDTRLAANLVAGPATVTDGYVAAFDGTTGKLIKQDTRLASSLVAGPATATDKAVALFDGTTGKLLKNGIAPGTSGNVLTSNGTDWTSAAPAGGTSFTSTDQTIALGGLITVAHGLGAQPKVLGAVLVCQTAENGYSIGDLVWSPLFNEYYGAYGSPGACYVDATNVNVRISATGLSGGHKTSGANVVLTAANWKLRIYARL